MWNLKRATVPSGNVPNSLRTFKCLKYWTLSPSTRFDVDLLSDKPQKSKFKWFFLSRLCRTLATTELISAAASIGCCQAQTMRFGGICSQKRGFGVRFQHALTVFEY